MVQIIEGEPSGLEAFLQASIPQISGGLQQMLQASQQKEQQQAQGNSLASFLGLSPEASTTFAGIHPEIQKEIAKNHIKNKVEAGESQQTMQTQFDRLAQLSRSKNIGIRTNPMQFLSDEAVAEQAEFESSKATLIAGLRELVNRGVLTNQKFQFITEKLLPQHNERQASIRGKLKAIASQLKLDPGSLGDSGQSGNVRVTLPDGRSAEIPRSDVDKYRKLSQQKFGKDLEIEE